MARRGRRRRAGSVATAPKKIYEGQALNQLVNRSDYLPFDFGWFPFGWMPGVKDIAPYTPAASDRKYGRDEPFVTTQQDVDQARALARYIALVNCPAVGIGENLKNYVIGPGFTFTAETKDKDAAPEGLVEAVQRVVDEFVDDNDFIGDLDRELFWRSRRDGEYFLALYPQRAGKTLARVIEPEQVWDPGAAPWSDEELSRQFKIEIPEATNWEFGVHKSDRDVQTVYGYCVSWDVGDVSYLPARLVEHEKSNVDRNVCRGITDFYPAWRWLRQQHELLQNTGEGAKEQAAISYIVEHIEGVTKSAVESMRQSQADLIRYLTSPDGGTKAIYQQYHVPGAKLDVPQGQKYVSGPIGAERGNAFLEVVQGILRQVASRWCMSEGMISSDDSNNAYASSIVAGSRFHRYAVCSQAKIGRSYYKIIWRAIENAFLGGRFSKFGLDWPTFVDFVDVDVSGPDVDEKSAADVESVREIRRRNGILSVKTWRQEAGLDHEQEEANFAEEQGEAQEIDSKPPEETTRTNYESDIRPGGRGRWLIET